MNIFTYQKTNRFIELINFEVPASWFQSINPLMIIFFGFYVSTFGTILKKKILSIHLFLKFLLEL